MSHASLRELIASLRAEGKSDIEIAAVLCRSRIKPLPGHYMWSAVSVREAVGEDPSGYVSSGQMGGHR